MAYAHVCATVPNFMILEWTYYLNKQYTSLAEPVTLKDGFLEVSDRPGIGVAINDAAVNERVEPGYNPL
jgi:galactonate dehydratase